MKNLIIIGARGFGREVLWPAKWLWYKGIRVKGFLDDDATLFSGFNRRLPPILSSVEDYSIQKNDCFFCALGNPEQRRKYCEIIKNKGGKFINIISFKADISPSAKIGEGCFIDAYSVVSDNVSIGDNTIIQRGAVIGHDAIISDYVTIGTYAFCGGGSRVGALTTINPHSTICRQVLVGERVVVGAGSAVIRRVPDNYHVIGVPAKTISLYEQ